MTKNQLIQEIEKLDQQLLELQHTRHCPDTFKELPLSEKFISNHSIFKHLTENIPIQIYAYQDNKYIYVNKALELCSGYAREELLQMNFWDCVHPDQQELVKKRGFARQLGKKESDRYEVKVLNKAGEEMWLDIFTSSSFDIDGETIIVVGCYDITESKSTKEKLVQSEARYRAIVEDQSELICRCLSDTTLTFVNEAACKYFHLTQEEMLAHSFVDFICEKDRFIIENRFQSLNMQNPVSVDEIRVAFPDDRLAWLECSIRLVLDDEQNFSEIQIVARDISERRYAQEQLKQARDELEIRVNERTRELHDANQELTFLNNNLKNIIDNMSDAVITFDKFGNIQILNSALEKTCGEYVKEEIAQRLKENIFNNNSCVARYFIEECKRFRNKEMTLSTPQGDSQYLVSGTPIKNDNGEFELGVMMVRPLKEVRELVNRFSGAQAQFDFTDIITTHPKMLKVIDSARRASRCMSNVLIEGESGTGKEMFAQAIHNSSSRHNGPFVALNCGAIPRDLIASELFGYAEGAFTGAKKGGSPGKFELASGGTLFLDEIGDMPFEQQVTLLRVIQEKQITRIGGDKVIPVDVRVICATNKNLLKQMENGNFRKDLYYRLNVIALQIPPLRERPEDIVALLKYYLVKSRGVTILETIEPEVKNYLKQYNWPGNVRELQNVVERMLFAAGDLPYINIEHLPSEILDFHNCELSQEEYSEGWQKQHNSLPEKARIAAAEVEKREIMELMEHHKGNISKVARESGVARSTLYRKMRDYGIQI